MSGSGDGYVRVKGILARKTGNAALIDFDLENDPSDKIHWIPLSLVHGGDEPLLSNENSTEVVQFRLREWKAEELGL